jgi:hypothetical protein
MYYALVWTFGLLTGDPEMRRSAVTRARKIWTRFNKFNPCLVHIRRLILPFRIERISGALVFKAAFDDLVAACVVRNGAPHIQSFLEHHRSLGISHFVFLDNGSTDNTLRLLSDKPGVTVLRTFAPYHTYENVMKTYLVERFCQGRWCLFVDIDELFDYPLSRDLPLNQLLRYLKQHNFNCVMTQMLDMFWADNSKNMDFSLGRSIKERYRMYDLSHIRKERYLFGDVPDERIMMHWGGIRHQVFGTNNGLTKISLFYLESPFVPFAEWWHHAKGTRIADIRAVLLHFPFVESFCEKVRDAVETRRYGYAVDDEYEAYLRAMTYRALPVFPVSTARILDNVDDLLETDFLVVSENYRNWVAEHGRITNRCLD